MGEEQKANFERRSRERAVGERLADARRRAGFTQAEAASRVGFSQSRVAKLEIGARRLTLIDAAAFAEAYGVSVLDFLGRPQAVTR